MNLANRDLEERLENTVETPSEGTRKKPSFRSRLKNWAASTSAGWVFYTPIMAPIEYCFAEMETEEVIASRFLAILGHTLGLHPYQKTREFLGKKFTVVEESGKFVKNVINAVSFAPTQPFIYAGMLACAGASIEEMQYAIPAGLGVVMATSPAFAPFMDFWRTKVFGMEPTYKKN